MINRNEIFALPAADRLRLVQDLWDSLEPEHVELEPALREELDRRLAEAEADPDGDLTWDEVKAGMNRRSSP